MGTKILIVDDDSDIRRGLNVRLQANGYEVLFAADAISALSVAVRTDLIILDIGLPAGDGYVVMERLQNYPALACVPVIILSHEAQPTTNNVHWRLGHTSFSKNRPTLAAC
jgi:DNA-binding response OmpR family regulator